MERRTYLQIPGPTNIPDRILRSLSQPLINHRGPEFGELLTKCVEGLKKVYKTKNDKGRSEYKGRRFRFNDNSPGKGPVGFFNI